MKAKKIQTVLSRLTGLSTLLFGVAWQPPKPESDSVRRLLAYPEDQRLLLGNHHVLLEEPNYVEDTLHRLRNKITEELADIDKSSTLAATYSSMRAACQRCLAIVERTHFTERVIWRTEREPSAIVSRSFERKF